MIVVVFQKHSPMFSQSHGKGDISSRLYFSTEMLDGIEDLMGGAFYADQAVEFDSALRPNNVRRETRCIQWLVTL